MNALGLLFEKRNTASIAPVRESGLSGYFHPLQRSGGKWKHDAYARVPHATHYRMPRHKPKNYLRTLRIAWGLTQRELGLLLGVSKDTVSKYERGINRLQPVRAILYELIFRVNTLELLVEMRDAAEGELGRRALQLVERLEGRSDPASLKKLELLAAIQARAL